MSEKPTSAHPQIAHAQHKLAASNRQPSPYSSPARQATAPERSPPAGGMLQRCYTKRAVDLLISWLRSKRVSSKHIFMERALSSQSGCKNLIRFDSGSTKVQLKLEIRVDLLWIEELFSSSSCAKTRVSTYVCCQFRVIE